MSGKKGVNRLTQSDTAIIKISCTNISTGSQVQFSVGSCPNSQSTISRTITINANLNSIVVTMTSGKKSLEIEIRPIIEPETKIELQLRLTVWLNQDQVSIPIIRIAIKLSFPIPRKTPNTT